MRLRIASRKSELARLQAHTVGNALLKKNPHLQLDFIFKSSLGDQNAHIPLWQSESKGVFTEDFYNDLVRGECDLVVHSWKDLPVEMREHTRVAATLEREDSRDVLLMTKKTFEKRSSSLTILTSSPRRVFGASKFLKKSLPWQVDNIQYAAVRGNVPTRIEKLIAGDGDILFVAKAALDRFLSSDHLEYHEVKTKVRSLMDQCEFQVWPLSVCPTAAAQGALAIEARSNDAQILKILASINHVQTFDEATAERNILKSYGGGCHQKIGISVLHRSFGEIQFIQGETQAGELLDSRKLISQGNWQPPAELSQFFPNRHERLFERELFDRSAVINKIGLKKDWWVARESSVPMDMSPTDAGYIWTAGIKTWAALAGRGFWVHGSADSLGERELPHIDHLAGKNIDWIKLTHTGSHKQNYSVVPTYKLKQNGPFDFSKKTHFYWMSGSQFERALELDPSLCSRGFHACGPGLTSETVQRRLTGDAQFQIFLSLEHSLSDNI